MVIKNKILKNPRVRKNETSHLKKQNLEKRDRKSREDLWKKRESWRGERWAKQSTTTNKKHTKSKEKREGDVTRNRVLYARTLLETPSL
jgi:hypothetical protein